MHPAGWWNLWTVWRENRINEGWTDRISEWSCWSGLVLGGSLMGDAQRAGDGARGDQRRVVAGGRGAAAARDLIPNLVETVKGFAKHEETVIDSVTKARAAMMGAQTPEEKIAANSQLDAALSAADGGGGKLSQPQGQREFPALAGRAVGHRKSHRGGAPEVQRDRCRSTTPTSSCSPRTSPRRCSGSSARTPISRRTRRRRKLRR